MAASPDQNAAPRAVLSGRWWIYPLVFIPSCLAATCWWLTEPLAGRSAGRRHAEAAPAAPVSLPSGARAAPEARAPVAWPGGRLEGRDAKRLLLDTLVRVARRLNKTEGYTATFHKQERIKGELGPVQTLAMKVRHRPFAVYMRFLGPHQGKEVVYAEGRHDNKVIAHGGGFTRLLVPRLAVAPDHPLVLADSRHPVTEAGLANLTARLIHFRRLDMDDPEAVTVLDRVTDDRGRVHFRSVHSHPVFQEERPFARVEVLYDPENGFPVDICSYDWPAPGHTGALRLAEHYAYDDIRLDADLTALDFDPANPNYAFHRY
jgi:hypothetical protein